MVAIDVTSPARPRSSASARVTAASISSGDRKASGQSSERVMSVSWVQAIIAARSAACKLRNGIILDLRWDHSRFEQISHNTAGCRPPALAGLTAMRGPKKFIVTFRLGMTAQGRTSSRRGSGQESRARPRSEVPRPARHSHSRSGCRVFLGVTIVLAFAIRVTDHGCFISFRHESLDDGVAHAGGDRAVRLPCLA